MVHLESIAEVRRICEQQRAAGRRVGLVPTMGYLHAGHISLIERARQLADFVVVSIFVNPLQFCRNEDLGSYPRDLGGDLEKCRAAGADLVFSPPVGEIYPPGHQTSVCVEQLSQGLCGASRPGHFSGVCTVVTKLFNIVGPCLAVFGEKDYQQLLVIRRMVRDLDMPVEVVGSPIVREDDGLAMSSRNAYLDAQQRRSARCLSRAISAIEQRLAAAGELPATEAVALARALIEAEPGTRIDHVEARDAETLAPAMQLGRGRVVVALAVFIGGTRLIDNRVI